MVYNACPQCGKRNHHNKVRCAECGLCLRAGRAGRKPKVKKNEQKISLPVGRPCVQVDVLCPSCGHSNDVRKVSKCTICEQNLVDKAGRPDLKSTTPCPSCDHLNEAKQTSCSVCEFTLISKAGRPEVKSTTPCPSCGHLNERKRVSCSECRYALISKAGRPEVKSTLSCPSCGHLNEAKRASCSVCECALISKGGRPIVKSTTPCPSCHQTNCSDHINCPSCQEMNSAENIACDNNCSQPLKQRVLRGRPVERREICQNCLQPNCFTSTMCTRCGEPLSIKRSRSTRPTSTGSNVEVVFNPSVELPTEWDTSPESVNISEDLLTKLKMRCMQQREFDQLALVDGMCYNCGRVLWSTNTSTLINPPNNMDPDCAPASAYLRAVSNNCQVHFIATSGAHSDEKWFCCSYCKKGCVPVEQHVGDIFNKDGSVKPISDWDMTKPDPISALTSSYERHQVSLCRLFSKTVKDAGVSQYKHIQGEVNSVRKLDKHFYGLFGFLACKSEGIYEHSPNPQSSLRIHHAINWLHLNNHLYKRFFSEYETLFRYVKPGFINPTLLEDQKIPLKNLLDEEAIGMAFPVDSSYFEQYPLIYNTDVEARNADVVGRQHPRPECQANLHDIVYTKYGEKHLDVKTFPYLHPWGFGGWHYECEMSFSAHVKMRLFDIRGWFASDFIYPFFKFDFMSKSRLRMYASKRCVQVNNLTEALNASKIKSNDDPYAKYGTEVPRSIPGSAQYWKAFGLDLVAMVEQRGLPDFFLTLSAHDGWPQVQATLREGWGAVASDTDIEDLAARVSDRQPVGWHPEVSVLAAEKRYRWLINLLKNDDGPLGQVEELVVKKEYQKRGAVHWHMLVWVKPGTAPPHAVMAEVPRGPDTSDKVAAYLRKIVETMMLHRVCNPNRCLKGIYGKPLTKCKYGFPYSTPQPCRELDDDHIRYLDMRRLSEDAVVVQYNPEIAILWGAHHNVQHVSRHGFEQYLSKYISKTEPSCKIDLPENCSEPQRYLRTRVIGAIEALEVLMGFEQHHSSRVVVYLPTELKPNRKTLKPKRDLESLPDDSENVYCETRLEKYLQRPPQLERLTYPDFFGWWDLASSSQQQKASDAAAEGGTYCVTRQGSDDFASYMDASRSLQNAKHSLSQLLNDSTYSPENRDDVIALVMSMRYNEVPNIVIDAVVKHYEGEGIDVGNTSVHLALSEYHCARAEGLL